METLDKFVEQLEQIFFEYQHSIPNKKSSKSLYFDALPYEKLTKQDLMFGGDRNELKDKLDLFFVSAVINGPLNEWPEEWGADKWYWQSKNNPCIVIYRKWITDIKSLSKPD